MTTPNWKKGQWLISRWKKLEGGETDLCVFNALRSVLNDIKLQMLPIEKEYLSKLI